MLSRLIKNQNFLSMVSFGWETGFEADALSSSLFQCLEGLSPVVLP